MANFVSYNNAEDILQAYADAINEQQVELTQAEYDALEQAGEVNPNTEYFISDAQGAVTIAPVNDSSVANNTVWSSSKVNTELGAKADAPTILSATLTAGSTTLTVTDSSITNTSLIDVYTDTYGVNPLTMSQSGTSITLTFAEQSSNVVVKVIVTN